MSESACWWLQQSGPNAGNITMTVEACCNGGYRLTYRFNGHSETTMVVDSALDVRTHQY
jgi:hypothetical protein